MAYRLRFGGYDFPQTLRPAGGDSPSDLAETELPRADGATSQPARKKSRILTVRGELTAGSADALQTAYDALKAACLAPSPQSFYFGRDDRHVLAQCDSWTDDYQDGLLYGLLVNLSIGFKASNPYFVSEAATTTALATNGGTVTPGGNGSALPTWTITILGAGTGPLTLTNTTTGETATLTGNFAAGDVLVLTRQGYVVTLNGVTQFGLLNGRLPSLAPSANVITLTAGGTATIASLSISYLPRYV